MNGLSPTNLVAVLGASVDVSVVVKSLVMLFVMYEVEAGSVRISVVVTTANG